MPSVTNYLCSQHHLAEKYAHDTIQSISKCWRFTAGAGEERNVGGVHCHRPHPLAPPTQSHPHFPHLPSPPSRPLYPPPSQLHLPRAEGSSPTELQVGLDHPNDQHPTVSHAHTLSHSHTHTQPHTLLQGDWAASESCLSSIERDSFLSDCKPHPPKVRYCCCRSKWKECR